MNGRFKSGLVRRRMMTAVFTLANTRVTPSDERLGGSVAPSVMLKKLSAFKRQNRLDMALAEISRIERTLFTLDWLERPELRRRC